MIDTLNKTDIIILKLLQDDSSLSNKQIAGILNKSSTTVSNRIKLLKAKGFIVKTIAILDPFKLNQKIHGYLYLALKDATEKAAGRFKEEVTQIKGIREYTKIGSRLNVKLKVITQDMSSFASIIQKITNLEGVKDLESYVVYETIIMDSGISF